MKRKYLPGLVCALFAGSASAQSLYNVGTEAQESIPLKWVVGLNLTYDDNIQPGGANKDSSGGLNPYVGLSFVNMTPQTTWDVYVRLGMIYYFDAPAGMDDGFSNSRGGVNLTHRFSERLRFSSRNFLAYELEPDYTTGYSSSRSIGEYFYWSSDNSIGYRWTERFATYTGIVFQGTAYEDLLNNDRMTWAAYNQFRYQLSPQTVLTASYRYAATTGDGAASDYIDHYITVGAEHRFSPNTIGILKVGGQIHNVDQGSDYTSPYLEFALTSQVNQQFRVRSFARYGIDGYDTVRALATQGLVEYDDKRTLRFGLSGDYAFTPLFSVFSGIDFIPSKYQEGRSLTTPAFGGTIPELDENIFNVYVGMSYRFNDFLTGTASYNFTDSSSDFAGADYNRNRVSVGLSAEF